MGLGDGNTGLEAWWLLVLGGCHNQPPSWGTLFPKDVWIPHQKDQHCWVHLPSSVPMIFHYRVWRFDYRLFIIYLLLSIFSVLLLNGIMFSSTLSSLLLGLVPRRDSQEMSDKHLFVEFMNEWMAGLAIFRFSLYFHFALNSKHLYFEYPDI